MINDKGIYEDNYYDLINTYGPGIKVYHDGEGGFTSPSSVNNRSVLISHCGIVYAFFDIEANGRINQDTTMLLITGFPNDCIPKYSVAGLGRLYDYYAYDSTQKREVTLKLNTNDTTGNLVVYTYGGDTTQRDTSISRFIGSFVYESTVMNPEGDLHSRPYDDIITQYSSNDKCLSPTEQVLENIYSLSKYVTTDVTKYNNIYHVSYSEDISYGATSRGSTNVLRLIKGKEEYSNSKLGFNIPCYLTDNNYAPKISSYLIYQRYIGLPPGSTGYGSWSPQPYPFSEHSEVIPFITDINYPAELEEQSVEFSRLARYNLSNNLVPYDKVYLSPITKDLILNNCTLQDSSCISIKNGVAIINFSCTVSSGVGTPKEFLPLITLPIEFTPYLKNQDVYFSVTINTADTSEYPNLIGKVLINSTGVVQLGIAFTSTYYVESSLDYKVLRINTAYPVDPQYLTNLI